MNQRDYTALVVGAGPAGLAISHELKRRNIAHLVLERGDRIAFTWRKLYESLTLHTGKHMSALPGMPLPKETPLFPPREIFLDYLERYTATFQLPIQTNCSVSRVKRNGNIWDIQTEQGNLKALELMIATGIISNPHIPTFTGRDQFRGQVIHSVEYVRAEPYLGKNVLVIGVANSGGEISSELARNGARVTISVRSGATVLRRELFGVPIQYYSFLILKLPRRVQRKIIDVLGYISERLRGPALLPKASDSLCPDIPLIGFHLVDAIRDGLIQIRGNVEAFTQEGVRFSDGTESRFDVVILATGYRAALGMLQGLIRLDNCGFACRTERVRSMDKPNLYFVGHNYNATGGLHNITKDARLIAQMIALKG